MGFVFALSGMLPALLAMYYVDRLDAVRPEPRWQLRKIAILGGLSTLPCMFVEHHLQKGLAIDESTPGGALFTAFVTAATTEEVAKAIVVWLFIWSHPAFDERMDGIVYATRAGLGFALVENVGYLLGSKSVGGFAGTYIARALLAVPGHAIWAAFMGYYAARKKFDGTGPGIWGGLAIAIFSHGAYDAALMLIKTLPKDLMGLVLLLLPIPIIVIVVGWRRIHRHAREALRLDELSHPGRPRLPAGLGFVLR
jgi:RsiW-degrading membrane proteinase PrsW (M82 family)